MIRPISISLSPNVEKDDVLLAFSLLFNPLKFFQSSSVRRIEEYFKRYLKADNAFAFNSGRSAMMAILNSLNLKKGDEVLVQAFTCNAVPNPILWEGLKPVYVDCNEDDFNMSPRDLVKKITKNSKVVVLQHTFGLPADIDAILAICKQYNLILIEDCAHSLGAKYKGRLVGSFGKASFFSFSRDKVISSVYGGVAVSNDKELSEMIKEYWDKTKKASFLWTIQQLLHPITMNWIILPTYSIFGKYLLVAFQWFNILSKAVHWKEKRGKKPSYFPKRLPEALAILAEQQLSKLNRFNSHRIKIAGLYEKELKDTPFKLQEHFSSREHIYLRVPVRNSQAHEIIKAAWKKNILLGDWYTSPIAPFDTIEKRVGYVRGVAPIAEQLSTETFNLPTHIGITAKEVNLIVSFLKNYGN